MSLRRIGMVLALIAGLVIYAYGFEVTQVNLQELGSPTRQESLARILRALARPDFVVYDQEEFVVERPIYIPCPAGATPAVAAPEPGAPYLEASACAEPESTITVTGHNFAPNTSGPLNFIPPSGVSLQIGKIETDGSGSFTLQVKLRDRTNAEAQLLRAVTRRNVGLPHLSQNGIDTINKIVETVFMALLATTLGTLLAIPVSFFAAQNLMRTVTTPFISLALAVIAAPLGAAVGALTASALADAGDLISTTPTPVQFGGGLVLAAVAWQALRWTLPSSHLQDAPGDERSPVIQGISLAVAVAGVILALFVLGSLLLTLGHGLEGALGAFAFLGGFVADLGGILRLLIVPLCALIGLGVMVNLAGQWGQRLVEHTAPATGKVLNLTVGAIAGAVLFVLIAAAVAWFYTIQNLTFTLYGPAVLGAVVGVLLALRTRYNESLPVGLVVYSLTRTVLNALRSIEALIMVIVFAVWVGIGPFAGVLALGLHTVASLAKLYSEQVESIAHGPLEAVLATGANRLQMIVYAVIPQIVPPYISFTMYRWDINVRMSTIIGFAGGGGIGFLLQQNINLLNYRAASAQILAIAIVVSLMDYLSSALRQRVI
ncbi:MAG: ABC transporter permease subunit [Caldilineaceae bacterium]